MNQPSFLHADFFNAQTSVPEMAQIYANTPEDA